MKSEHRHQLETNVLSAKLARSIDNLKPFTGQIVTGFVLLAALYLGLSVWDSQTAQREQAAWEAFALATDTSDPELKGLQRVAGDVQYEGTKMQEWAYVGWCDRQVLNAMQTFLIDREITDDRLRSVSGIYENLAASAGDPQVKNRARFGLGRVYELQNKLDEAREQYLQVRGDLQPQASERATQLESEDVRETCQWLASAELPKRDLTGGQGASGQRPDFKAGLPVADGEGDTINAKSLEELLGDFRDEVDSEKRYGETETSVGTSAEEATDSATANDDATGGEDEEPADNTSGAVDGAADAAPE